MSSKAFLINHLNRKVTEDIKDYLGDALRHSYDEFAKECVRVADNPKDSIETQKQKAINSFQTTCKNIETWDERVAKGHALKVANYMVREFSSFDFLGSVKTFLAVNLCAVNTMQLNGTCAASVKVTDKQGLFLIKRSFSLSSRFVKNDPDLFFETGKHTAASRERDLSYFLDKSILRGLKDLYSDYKKHNYQDDMETPDDIKFENEEGDSEGEGEEQEEENEDYDDEVGGAREFSDTEQAPEGFPDEPRENKNEEEEGEKQNDELPMMQNNTGANSWGQNRVAPRERERNNSNSWGVNSQVKIKPFSR